MKKYALVMGLIAIACTSARAEATSHKIFAGNFQDVKELRDIVKGGETMTNADATVIPCEAGTQFGVAYLLEIPNKMQRESREHEFTEVWTYPEAEQSQPAVVSREIQGQFKRQRSNPLFSGSVVDTGLEENAEFHLEVRKQGETYLEHTFQVKGCSEETLPQLAQAMADAESQEMICTMEQGLGTRIKKRVCRTEAQIENDRDMMEQQLRRSSR